MLELSLLQFCTRNTILQLHCGWEFDTLPLLPPVWFLTLLAKVSYWNVWLSFGIALNCRDIFYLGKQELKSRKFLIRRVGGYSKHAGAIKKHNCLPSFLESSFCNSGQYRQRQFCWTSVLLHTQDVNKTKINWCRSANGLLGKVLHGFLI